jgi:hypothetical protein
MFDLSPVRHGRVNNRVPLQNDDNKMLIGCAVAARTVD